MEFIFIMMVSLGSYFAGYYTYAWFAEESEAESWIEARLTALEAKNAKVAKAAREALAMKRPE